MPGSAVCSRLRERECVVGVPGKGGSTLNSTTCDSGQLSAAVLLLERAVGAGFIPGYATAVHLNGKQILSHHGGSRVPGDPESPVDADTPFLIASLTKPIVCAGALLLAADGAFALHQPVRAFIPEFRDGRKDEVRLFHLFTHTSGLYDQLPRSKELRAAHAPIEQFVREVCRTDLLFAPGTRVSYQSMGILLIGEIVERVSGMQLREYLQTRLFAPLRMTNTVLGMPNGGMERAAHSLDAPFARDSNDVGDDWNTAYWRNFGAPWGGLHSTAADLGVFLSHTLGQTPGPLSPAVRKAMVADQTALLPLLSRSDTAVNRWGLGWALGLESFGTFVSRSTFGHRGATGSLFWADPDTRLSCVLLTNQPRVWRESPPEFADLPARYSNTVAAGIQ